jgi:hypothetical protein
MRRIFLASMLLLISGTAHAADPAQSLTPTYTDEKPAAPQPTKPEATRIETDQKTGTVRIIVDGREVARFERDGLHVRQNVDYGGLMKDTGQDGYNPRTAAEPKH